MNEEQNVTCQECGDAFDIDTILGIKATHCFDCVEKLREKRYQEEQERIESTRMAAITKAWPKICPPLFRSVEDIGAIPRSTDTASQNFNSEAWKVISRTSIENGMGLIGKTGSCKTRMAWLRLREVHYGGGSVFGVTACDLAEAIQTRMGNESAHRVIRKAKSTGVLLLDDVGKNKMTEAVEAIFFAVIDDRYKNGRPIIWTSNLSGSELETHLEKGGTGALIRRLSEVGEPIEI